MGNRAVITTKSEEMSVYLHWHGGYEWVTAFLEYCKLKEYRPPETDTYGWARLCQVVGNFFGGALSVGIEPKAYDPGDNGVYTIKNWEIIKHTHMRKQVLDRPIDLKEHKKRLLYIDERMPEHDRLGADYITAKEIPTAELKVGDVILNKEFDEINRRTVVGIGEDEWINGTNVKGIPYVDLYEGKNINNFILDEKVRKAGD